MIRAIPTVILIFVLASCKDTGDSVSFNDAQGVYITALTTGFQIRNSSPETVYYYMLEYEKAMHEDPTMPMDSTNSIAPGGTRNVPYLTIRGYSHNCKVFVWLWNATGDHPLSPRSGSGRTLIVRAD
jgi:hypothetical protein